MVMSDNEQAPSSSQAQNQSHTVNSDSQDMQEHDNDRGEVQSDTLKCLNEVVSDYIAQ